MRSLRFDINSVQDDDTFSVRRSRLPDATEGEHVDVRDPNGGVTDVAVVVTPESELVVTLRLRRFTGSRQTPSMIG